MHRVPHEGRPRAGDGDASVREDMQRLCARDRRHVACDVAETTSWGMLELSSAMKRVSDELEAEGDAEEDAAGAE